jgi:multicomponent Na+:H+ antiporter subunit G
MYTILSGVLLVIGVLFMLLSGIGILRMPDVFMRMSVTTKAATLGVSSILLALAVYFSDLGVASRAIATIIFLLLTAPVAAHMIARAAYIANVPLCENTVIDDLSGHYDPETHELESQPYGNYSNEEV